MVKTPWISVALGALSIPLTPVIFAVLAAEYTVHQPGITPVPGAALELHLATAVCVVVSFSVLVAQIAIYQRTRSNTAIVGLLLSAVGPFMLLGGFVLFAAAAIVGVMGLWLSSLV